MSGTQQLQTKKSMPVSPEAKKPEKEEKKLNEMGPFEKSYGFNYPNEVYIGYASLRGQKAND